MNKEKLNDIICESSSDYDILNDAYNYIENLEQKCKKYKEAIEKIKTRYCDYYGTTKEVNDNYVLRSVLKEILEILKEVE